MKKRSSPAIPPTAFSIARQFSGPPFSVTLESTELRRHLMEEMLQPAGSKARAGNLTAKQPATASKAPAKRRNKQPKKQAQPGPLKEPRKGQP